MHLTFVAFYYTFPETAFCISNMGILEFVGIYETISEFGIVTVVIVFRVVYFNRKFIIKSPLCLGVSALVVFHWSVTHSAITERSVYAKR